MVRIESRHKRRRWLPRHFPGNVYALILHDEMTLAEARETAEYAMAHRAFGVVVETSNGHLITMGAVRARQAE